MTDWAKVRKALNEIPHDIEVNGSEEDDEGTENLHIFSRVNYEDDSCPKCAIERELVGTDAEEGRQQAVMEYERLTLADVIQACLDAGYNLPADVGVVIRIDEEYQSIVSVQAQDIPVDEGDTGATTCVVLGV